MSKKNKTIVITKELKEAVIEVFNNNPRKKLNYKQVAGQLNIEDKETRRAILIILEKLEKEQILGNENKGCFYLKQERPHQTGRVQITGNGAAFVILDEGVDDVFIPPRMLRNALDGDRVKVYVFTNKKIAKLEGEIIEIIERANLTFVGVVEVSKNFAFLIPSNSRMHNDIFIPIESLNGAKDGQKAIAKITNWPTKAKNPIGEIVDVLGQPGENNTEMHAILSEFGLPYSFPEELEKEADKISKVLDKKEISRRRDFRDIITFTIDPVDAKDFDDALSLKKLENGNWEVGVHIADVSYYVSPGSAIDEEAYKRATSVYLVDRVVPMLPEILSNELCSLRPNEEKFCFSAVFEMNEKAEVLNEWFGRTVILSDQRFSYEEAQKVIETGEGKFKDEIFVLHDLATKLREQRFKNGSIDFHSTEVKFDLDEEGNPLGVHFKVQKESNMLIEDFMLLANRKVAAFATEKIKSFNKKGDGENFVYRVHDQPNQDKLNSFTEFISKLGYKTNIKAENASASINKLMEKVKGTKEEGVISVLAIRSMAKATYTTKNIGHYGLGFSHYSHFTSPIRRYPDLMVHRLLQQVLDGKFPQEELLEEKCKHSSAREKLAADAERASIKYKQAQFLEKHIGETFEGTISGVTEWGIYVEIDENKCEGMIRLRDINDDFYVFDEENYCIVGRRYKNIYRLADKVMVKVKKVNIAKKQIDFQLVAKDVDNVIY
jgi:ribonuclease R